jgi:tight adherence protein B
VTRARAVVAAWLAASVLVVVAAPSAAHADAVGSLESVHADGRQLDLVLSASGIPTGATLDPASVVVTVDGADVAATATATASGQAVHTRRTAMIVIDTSGSMAGAPIAQVKQAALSFLTQVPSDVLVGLVSFADSARLDVRPTLDRRAVRARISALQAAGSTTLYDGIRLALGQLPLSGERLLCVLSDGADTSSRASLAAVTTDLRRARVTTDLVGFRTDPTQTATLRTLAADVGGRLIPVNDVRSLVGAFSVAAGSFATQVQIVGRLTGDLADGDHQVSVSVRFGTQTVSDSTTFTAVSAVAVPSASAQPAAAASAAAGLARPAVLVPLLLLVFVSLFVLLLAVLVPRGRADTRRNLRSLEAYGLAESGPGRHKAEETQETQTGLAQTALGVSERFVERRGTHDRLALRLEQADVRLTAGEWVLLRTCAGAAAIAVSSVLLGNVLLGLLVGVVLTGIVAHLFLSVRAGRRTAAFEAALPDILQLVASSIRTGFSLPQALDAAAQGGGQPISGELNRALAEARLGAPLEDGLDRVADRMDSQDLRWTVMAIRIQREVGGNLSEVLHTTATTMRERSAMRRRVRALSAEGRMSAYILIALPLLLAAFLFLTRRQYLSPLWTTTPGLVMVGAGCVGMLVGCLWMRKLVEVEV